MWQQWIADLPKLEHLTEDRCYKPPDFGKVKSTLHHFSEASLKGYGTVRYLRSENEDGDVHCAIVIAKARVAPVKLVTVPRLELNAATVAVRVNAMVQLELEIPVKKTVFWTDSMTVLRYINNESARFQGGPMGGTMIWLLSLWCASLLTNTRFCFFYYYYFLNEQLFSTSDVT